MSASSSIARLCDSVGLPEPRQWRDYFAIVKGWGARTDLTAARSDEALTEILFLDAAHLLAAGWLDACSSLLDIGAGVGAPTIPLALACPAMRATLVEPRRKRTAFLRSAIGSLDLATRVVTHEARIDPMQPAVEGGPFDIALSRATFPPEQWRSIGAELAAEVWVFTAGTDIEGSSRLRLARRLEYEVPSTGAPRTILAYRG